MIDQELLTNMPPELLNSMLLSLVSECSDEVKTLTQNIEELNAVLAKVATPWTERV